MPKETVFVVDLREKHLHPLRTRKDDLISKQSLLANQGEHLSDEEQAELRGIIDSIAAVHAPPGETAGLSVPADFKVQCFGVGKKCNARMDVSHDKNVIAHVNSVRILDPTAEPNDQNVWVHPPSLGTIVLCSGCWARMQARFEEQRFEVDRP